MENNLNKFQEKIGYTFRDEGTLLTALTHRSSLNEVGVKESNERLEFLGDAVLELLVTNFLYHERPADPEGFLTAARSAIVRTATLAQIARDIDLGECLRMSKGEAMGGGRENPSLLENAVEALIGAIYKDGGMEPAAKFIDTFIIPHAQTILSQNQLKDPKSLYQEKVQSAGELSPVYKIIQEEGPDHDKIFEVAVYVAGVEKGRGKGKSKQEAEQLAAKNALESLPAGRQACPPEAGLTRLRGVV